MFIDQFVNLLQDEENHDPDEQPEECPADDIARVVFAKVGT